MKVIRKKSSWAAVCLVAMLVASCASQDSVTKEVETPAATEPQQELWLGELLAEEPTVASGLFRVVDEKVIERDGIEVGQATVEFDYLDIHGQPAEAQANLFVERSAVENGGKTPLATFVHYESSPDGSVGWCRRGWAMLTPHLNPQHALGNSFNLDLAMIEWGRRLPFVDRQHLAIVGGSAGGYMALAMSAEVFPVAATVADAPVVNWAYNAAFLVKNLDLAKGTAESPLEWQKAPLPVMLAVSPIALDAQKLFGQDLASDAWYKLSPISYEDAAAEAQDRPAMGHRQAVDCHGIRRRRAASQDRAPQVPVRPERQLVPRALQG